jgi:polyhydroxybutyrate depolymerase
VTVAGAEHPYLLAAPEGAAVGLVVCLHGRGVTPQWQADLCRMDRLAAQGAVVAFPRGSIMNSRNGYSWDPEADVATIDGVVAALREEFPAAPPAVCLAGLSAGGRMASLYAGVRAGEVGALAAVAGLRAPRVVPQAPVPVIAFHGLEDAVNPYDGRRSPTWYESVPEAARAWGLANRVAEAAAEIELSGNLRLISYGEGLDAEVLLWVFARAGHTWPGSHPGRVLRLLLGRTSEELDATAEIWRFFRRHQP